MTGMLRMASSASSTGIVTPASLLTLTTGTTPGTLADNANFIRLAQFFNTIHTAGGGSVDALVDVHAEPAIPKRESDPIDPAGFTSPDSSARTTLVPTAMTRPPDARVAFTASAVFPASGVAT